MAITRTKYITIAEYTEVIGSGTATEIEIAEASEALRDYMRNKNTYDVSTAPDTLKIATAKQVEYKKSNPDLDDEYSEGADKESLGKWSVDNGSSNGGTKGYKKISPVARRILLNNNFVNRGVNTL